MKKVEFGKKLQELRNGKGESQSDLGEILDVGIKQIQRYEGGKAVPPPEGLVLLCEHYKYDFISLLFNLKANEEGNMKQDDKYLALLEKNEIKNEKIIESQEADLKALRSAVNKITATDQRVAKLETTVDDHSDKWKGYEPMILGLQEFVTEELAILKKLSRQEVAVALGKKVAEQKKKVEQSHIQKD